MRWNRYSSAFAGLPGLPPSLLVSLHLVVGSGACQILSASDVTNQGKPRANAQSAVAQPSAAQDTAAERLQREKLQYEIAKLQADLENSTRDLTSTRGWINLVFDNLPVLVAIAAGVWAVLKYLKDNTKERSTQADERFEEVVKGFGSEQVEAKISAAAVLATFLRNPYEKFYVQVFNLAGGALRTLSPPSVNAASSSASPHADGRAAGPGERKEAALRQALVTVFRDAFIQARDQLPRAKDEKARHGEIARVLNGTGVVLESAYLASADLQWALLREANLRRANLNAARLSKAILEQADLTAATLEQADLTSANLTHACLDEAILNNAELSGAQLDDASLRRAKLHYTVMKGGSARGVDFTGAELTKAEFEKVDFSGHPPQADKSTLGKAKLTDAKFTDIKGLTESEISECKALGASFVFTEEATRARSPA